MDTVPRRGGFRLVVDTLYYDKAPDDVSASFDFYPEVLRKALLKIYSKDFHLASDIETNLFNEVFDSLKLGIDKGVGMAKGLIRMMIL